MKYSKIILLAIVVSMIAIPNIAYAQEGDGTYIIGLFIRVGEEAFKAEMAELGYIEGENVTYIVIADGSWPEQDQEQFNLLIQEMVDAPADVIVTDLDSDAVNLQPMTGDIPIVFARSDNPVATGAVADLIEPGGHITGVMIGKPHERRLQLLTEINPATDSVYYLYTPSTPEAEGVLQELQELAGKLDITLETAPVADEESLLAALENPPEDADWFFPSVIVNVTFLNSDASHKMIADIAASRRMGMAALTDLPVQGYVMGYGPNLDDTARQAAHIVDRILRGANPGDLPVQPAEHYLTVNLEAAEAIGLKIPVSVLRQADIIVRPGYFDETENSGD